VRLDPLVPAMALELVRAQQGGEAIPAQLAERICATADGNPLFVEEIVGGLRDSPALRQLDGRWVFSGDPDVVEIPPTIRALLGARIERVPAEERVILEAAAVIGRSFESEALVELIPGSDRASLGPRLRSLVRRELIQADRAMIGSGDAFRFRHVLVRDAAYGALPKSRRATLHSTYARWLAKISGDRIDEYAEIIGYHLAEAYDYQAAREPGSAATRDLAIRGCRVPANRGRARQFARRPGRRGQTAGALHRFDSGRKPGAAGDARRAGRRETLAGRVQGGATGARAGPRVDRQR